MKFAFNIWSVASAQAVLHAKNSVDKIILQTSASLFDKIDCERIAHLVYDYNNRKNGRILLNLDHARELGVIRRAIDMGYTSVMIDASHLPLKENIKITNEVTRYAHKKNVVVEAEVGFINGVEDSVTHEGCGTVNYLDVITFLAGTDVDSLAVAVGTAHGIYVKQPDINWNLIANLQKTVVKPIVIHGGSGLDLAILQRLISYPVIGKVNFSTDVKQAFKRGVQKAAKASDYDLDALNLEKEIYSEITDMVERRLELL